MGFLLENESNPIVWRGLMVMSAIQRLLRQVGISCISGLQEVETTLLQFLSRGAGLISYLGQGADLHMAQLMPLPLTISCSSKPRLVLPFWYWLSRPCVH